MPLYCGSSYETNISRCLGWKKSHCVSPVRREDQQDAGKKIIERYDGDIGVNPIKICDGILWPVKSGGFRPCP